MSREIDNFKNLSLNNSSATPPSSSSPRNTPLSSSPNYRNTMSPPALQPDLQARVLAFQNKRMGQSSNSISRSSSLHESNDRNNNDRNHHYTNDNNNNNNNNDRNIPNINFSNNNSNVSLNSNLDLTQLEKPLPPLPSLPNSNSIQNLNIEIKKKSSLSERRGMKLNVAELADITAPSSPQDISTEPLPGINGQRNNELSRRFSDRNSKKKPNFKLDLSDSTGDKTPVSNSPQDEEPKLPGMFANYSKYIDIKKGELKFSGKASLHSKGVDFSSGHSFRISMDELQIIDELGRGNYGSVLKVRHKPTNIIMAMKEVRLELDETKFTQILMELDILHKCNSPYIVDFYGAFFSEGAVYMCMEFMDGGSLDKIYGKSHGVELEQSLAYITECVIRGLKELKDEHNIIHRDVKPTNILVNTNGKVKLCDFGVSGNLVASLAKTNIGCQSYMAPERIKTSNPNDATYSVQSDIWSLGLTILEVACGHYPYPPETYDNIFSQLSAIVDGEPPKLDPIRFSKQAQMFVKSCLNKNPDSRPTYSSLLNNPWLLKYRGTEPHIADQVIQRLKEITEEGARLGVSRSDSGKTTIPVANPMGKVPENIENVKDLLKKKVKPPALHRTRLMRKSNTNPSFTNR